MLAQLRSNTPALCAMLYDDVRILPVGIDSRLASAGRNDSSAE